MSEAFRVMDAFQIFDAPKSDTVKVVTLQFTLTIDGRFDSSDANQVLAGVLNKPDCLVEDRDPADNKLEVAERGIFAKLEAIDRFDAFCEDMGDIAVVGEEVRRRDSRQSSELS